jgi:hypothetical protein
MSSNNVSRRRFIQNAATNSTALAVGAATGLALQLPRRAWTILGVNWEYNDEFCYEAGEFVEPRVFFDEAEAIAACQKLCDAFFGESPQEFQPCWDAYEVDPANASWDDLRRQGFPDPYYVKELTR